MRRPKILFFNFKRKNNNRINLKNSKKKRWTRRGHNKEHAGIVVDGTGEVESAIVVVGLEDIRGATRTSRAHTAAHELVESHRAAQNDITSGWDGVNTGESTKIRALVRGHGTLKSRWADRSRGGARHGDAHSGVRSIAGRVFVRRCVQSIRAVVVDEESKSECLITRRTRS